MGYANQRYSIITGPTREYRNLLMANGDSITLGFLLAGTPAADAALAWPAQTAALLGSWWQWRNFAVTSSTVPQEDGYAATDERLCFDGGWDKLIMAMAGGSNDIGGGATAADVLASLTTYFTNNKAAYGGLGANIKYGAATYISRNWVPVAVGGAITNASNATPIQITTTTAHGLSTGQTVTIAGVTGNTAANGSWTITKVDALNFRLDTSVGNGAYTGGGTTTVTAATMEAQRVAFNAALPGQLGAIGADFLLDFAGNPLMGAPGAYANATYFIDGVHPTFAGQGLMAATAVAAITPLL